MTDYHTRERFLHLKESYHQMKKAQGLLERELSNLIISQACGEDLGKIDVSIVLPERVSEKPEAGVLLQHVQMYSLELLEDNELILRGEDEVEGEVIINLRELTIDEKYELSKILYTRQKKKQERDLERKGRGSLSRR